LADLSVLFYAIAGLICLDEGRICEKNRYFNICENGKGRKNSKKTVGK